MKIKELLADESKWTQFAMAKTVLGRQVGVHDELAVRFCLVGAINRCYQGRRFDIAIAKLRKVIAGPMTWNDSPRRTFAEVRALIEKLDI